MNCIFSIELIRNLFEKFLGVPDQSGIKGGEYRFKQGREPTTNSTPINRNLKIRRRQRQRHRGRQKSYRFNNENNNFASASGFFVHFLAVTARQPRENVYRGSTQSTTIFLLYFSTWMWLVRIQL